MKSMIPYLRRAKLLKFLQFVLAFSCLLIHGNPVSAGGLPEVMSDLLRGRSKIEAGRLSVRVVREVDTTNPEYEGAIRIYSVTFDSLNSKYEMQEEVPLDTGNPVQFKAVITPQATRIMPHVGVTIHDEIRSRPSETISLASNFTFNFRALGLYPARFSKFRSLGLIDVARILEARDATVTDSSIAGLADATLCDFEGKRSRIRYAISKSGMRVPINIKLQLRNGSKFTTVEELDIAWSELDFPDLYLPTRCTFSRHVDDAKPTYVESWELTWESINQSIDEGEFTWKGMGIQDGDVVTVSAMGQNGEKEELSMLSWNGSSLADYEPRYLTQAQVNGRARWTGTIALTLLFLFSAVFFGVKSMRSRRI